MDILFQSIAGTDRVLAEEFDVTVDLLDSAYYKMLLNGKKNWHHKELYVFRDWTRKRNDVWQTQ